MTIMVKSSLCVSRLRKRCVALCFKKLLELLLVSWKCLEPDDERPALRISLPMSTSFYLFWPSKSLLLLFWIRELGDAKETILNQEYSRKHSPSFRSSIPRSWFKFRQKNTYPCYVHFLGKTFTLMICRLLIKQLMIMSGLSDSLVRSDIDMSH